MLIPIFQVIGVDAATVGDIQDLIIVIDTQLPNLPPITAVDQATAIADVTNGTYERVAIAVNAAGITTLNGDDTVIGSVASQVATNSTADQQYARDQDVLNSTADQQYARDQDVLNSTADQQYARDQDVLNSTADQQYARDQDVLNSTADQQYARDQDVLNSTADQQYARDQDVLNSTADQQYARDQDVLNSTADQQYARDQDVLNSTADQQYARDQDVLNSTADQQYARDQDVLNSTADQQYARDQDVLNSTADQQYAREYTDDLANGAVQTNTDGITALTETVFSDDLEAGSVGIAGVVEKRADGTIKLGENSFLLDDTTTSHVLTATNDGTGITATEIILGGNAPGTTETESVDIRVANDLFVDGDLNIAGLTGDVASRINSNSSAIANNSSRIASNKEDIEQNTRGIAMVAALQHTTVLPGMNNAFDLSAAHFEGETGLALNYARRINENVQINFGAASTTDFDESVIKAGIGVQW